MELYIEKEDISGEIDYFNDNCSGTLEGKIISNNELILYENITTGKDICANGKHFYSFKLHIINEANYYDLEDTKNQVVINSYKFTPKPNIWENISLKLVIEKKEKEIEVLKEKLEKPRLAIEQAKKEQSKAQYHLDHNHTGGYINAECIAPELATPKPDPFYDTKEKAKHHALAYCSVSFGCRVGVELARNSLDTGSKRFLASQSCTLMVRNYQEEGTLLDETMFNLLDAVTYAGCNDDSSDGIFSGLVQGGSCIMSAATRLARVGQYMGCIDYKTQAFHNTYLDWKNEPQKKKTACEKDLKVMDETPKIILEQERKIKNIKNEIDIEKQKLKELKNELEKVLLLREKQSELIRQLQSK